MKTKLSVASISALGLATALTASNSWAASNEIDQRWFEVEVILFSQLGDKLALRERFEKGKSLPNYHTFDLLSEYLQPNLSLLKAQLPQCSEGRFPQDFITQASQPEPFYTIKSIEDIEYSQQVILDGMLSEVDLIETTDINNLSTADTAGGQNVSVALDASNPTLDDNSQTDNPLDEQTTHANLDGNTDVKHSSDDILVENTDDESLIGLTEEQIALINQAELAFQPAPLSLSEYQPQWFSLVSNNRQFSFCTPSNIENQGQSDHFPVPALTGRISASEFVYTDNPYLIHSDSLQLKDIYLQLLRSRDFKPLLHLGWRQSLINRKPADENKALKIYAGEHFQQNYHDENQAYQFALEQQRLQKQLAALREVEKASNQESVENTLLADNTDSASNISTISPAQEKLQYIFDHIDQQTFERAHLLAGINHPEINTDLLNQVPDGDSEHTLKAPIQPPQPWYIDGLFRLHLSHYLYITADFNVSNLTESEVATAKLNNTLEEQWISVPFTQNRRVISGEVHYFDHPYMGMVVQIRRYEKPEPETEETLETDDINNNINTLPTTNR